MSNLSTFFANAVQQNNNWTHQYNSKSYHLTESETQILWNLNPAPGTFKNLEEKNFLKEGRYRFVVDLDYPRTEAQPPREKEITQCVHLIAQIVDKPVWCVVTHCLGRYHLYYLNLVFENVGSMTHLRTQLRNLDNPDVDLRGGNSHFLMHGSLKERRKPQQQQSNNNNCGTNSNTGDNARKFDLNNHGVRLAPYKLYAYYYSDPVRAQNFSLKKPSTWPYSSFHSLFVLLALQRPYDPDTDFLIPNLVPAINKRKLSDSTTITQSFLSADDSASSVSGKKRKQQDFPIDKIKRKFFISLIMFLAPTLSTEYNNWVRVGFVIANEMGDQGRSLWHSFSSYCVDKYAFSYADEKWTNILKSHQANVFGGGEEETMTIPSTPKSLMEPLTGPEQILCRNILYAMPKDAIYWVLGFVAEYIVTIFNIKKIKNNQYQDEQNLIYYRDGVYIDCRSDENIDEWRRLIDLVEMRILAHKFNNSQFELLYSRFATLSTELWDKNNSLWHKIAKCAPMVTMNPFCFIFPNDLAFDLNGRYWTSWGSDLLSQNWCNVDIQNVSIEDLQQIDKLMDDWFPGPAARNYVMNLLRSTLIPGNEGDRGIYVFYGPKGNGKSLFMKIIAAMFNNKKLVLTLPISDFLVNKPMAISAIFKSCTGIERIGILPDFPLSKTSANGYTLLKQISGSDEQSGRVPYGRNNYEATFKMKIFIVTNEDPVIPPEREELYDRFRMIFMRRTFTKTDQDDTTLMSRTTKLGAALMSRVLSSWEDLQLNPDKFARLRPILPPDSEEYLEKIKYQTDYIHQFITEEMVESSGSEIPLGLFKASLFDFLKSRNIQTRPYTLLKIQSELTRLNVTVKDNTILNYSMI